MFIKLFLGDIISFWRAYAFWSSGWERLVMIIPAIPLVGSLGRCSYTEGWESSWHDDLSHNHHILHQIGGCATREGRLEECQRRLAYVWRRAATGLISTAYAKCGANNSPDPLQELVSMEIYKLLAADTYSSKVVPPPIKGYHERSIQKNICWKSDANFHRVWAYIFPLLSRWCTLLRHNTGSMLTSNICC